MVERGREGSGETKLETAISYVLIVGVILSLILEIAGIILFYRQYGTLAISERHSMFIQDADFFSFLGRLLHETSAGADGMRLMVLGIAILILTPYVRAVMSVIYFAVEKNIKYFLITLFVLMVLTISLMLH